MSHGGLVGHDIIDGVLTVRFADGAVFRVTRADIEALGANRQQRLVALRAMLGNIVGAGQVGRWVIDLSTASVPVGISRSDERSADPED